MKKTVQTLTTYLVIFALTGLMAILPYSKTESAAVRKIIYPVTGASSFVNDFNAPRWLPHRGKVKHNATDIMAQKGQLLVAVTNGTIIDVQYPQPRWGYSVTIMDSAGYTYTYIHMNDDRPGTNDGRGGAMNAYVLDVKVGNRVIAGQLLGRVGDSGFSNGIPHLHFEINSPKGTYINPYYSLRAAKRISKPVAHPVLKNEILPYKGFRGGANIAMGNFDADIQPEFITGAGKGGGPHIRTFDHNGLGLRSFFAYPRTMKGGVDVAAGDIDGDGIDEIITGVGSAGEPLVKVFRASGTLLYSFLAYDVVMDKGIKVTAGDLDGDGIDEIVTGAGQGAAPYVQVFKLVDGQPELIKSFRAYNERFRGGLDVAVADVLGDEGEDIITGAGPGGGPHVRIFDQDGLALGGFYAYAKTSRTGVRVSAANVRTSSVKAEILTVPASVGNPEVKMFTGLGLPIGSRMFLERWWVGSYDIAAGFDTSKASAGGNRRSTVRLGID